MSTISDLQTIVIGAGSTHVSSGAETGNGPAFDQQIDTNNDGKIDYVVHQGTRTISFAKEFLRAKPQMCAIITRTFKMTQEPRPLRDSDQRQFDSGRNLALNVFNQFKDALRTGKSHREDGALTFRGQDGIQRSVRDFETKDGRLSSLTISGGDGKQIRIEDPAMLKSVQKALDAHQGGTLIAKRVAR
jgi:hypothetical protein